MAPVPAVGEIMVLGGKPIFLLMSCFDKMARGGLQSFFHWLSEHSAYTPTQPASAACLFSNHFGGQKQQQALTSKHRITASLAMGIEFFLKGIPLLTPRIYHLGPYADHQSSSTQTQNGQCSTTPHSSRRDWEESCGNQASYLMQQQ